MTVAMSEAENRTGDHFGTALAYLLLGVSGGLGLDLCAKKLLETYPIEQFVFLRSVFGMLVFLLSARWYGGFGALRSRRRSWHLLRTLLSVGAMFGFFYGLARMPLVNALTIAFMAPLIVTALSVPFLGEHVGWRRWLAIAVGLLGVLIVLRPFGTGFQPAALFAVMGVIFMSARDLATRKITTNISTLQLSVIGFMATIPAGALSLVISGSTPAVPTGQTLLYLIGAISIGVPALYCIISAMRIGDISFVSPFRYSRIIFGLLAGLLVFGETLDFYTVLGAAIIVGSGSYTLLREARLRRSSQTAKPTV